MLKKELLAHLRAKRTIRSSRHVSLKRDELGQLAERLLRLDLVILDELGYLPFSPSGGALLFHLLSKLYDAPASSSPPTSASANGPSCPAIPR